MTRALGRQRAQFESPVGKEGPGIEVMTRRISRVGGQIRWRHVALVKALLTSDSVKEMQTWFSVGRGTVFQSMISGDSGKLNAKCYISPESAKSEFSVSGIRFCTESNVFTL